MDDKMKSEQTNVDSSSEEKVKEDDIPFIDEDEEPGEGPSKPIPPPVKVNLQLQMELCIEYSSSSSEYSRDQFWDDYSTPTFGSYESEHLYPYGEIPPCPQLAEDETAIDMPPEEPGDGVETRTSSKLFWWFVLVIITIAVPWALKR